MNKYVGFRLGKVHESHVISEYYCGGCGWPVTDHDSFCPECGGAFRYNTWEASALEAENAELRELVRDLWPFVKAGLVSACPNRECCLFEECDADSEYECLIEEHMAGRMRELGVWVTDGD